MEDPHIKRFNLNKGDCRQSDEFYENLSKILKIVM